MRSFVAKLRWGKSRRWLGAAVLSIAFISVAGHAGTAVQQQFPPIQGAAGNAPFGEPPDPNDPMQRQRAEKMAKARNADRQQQLVRDTDKLLALAKQLKEDVGKSDKETLSIDVVKKAAEIEKLAKSVKDRMRG